MAEVKFNDNAKKEYSNILTHYPASTESAILPVLYLAQKEFGYISDDVVRYIAELLNVSAVRIAGVASFYTMYNKKSVGRYHMQICHNLSCSLDGSEELIRFVQEKLSIKSGETTSDGLFTLTEVECLGACGEGPIIQVNDDYHVKMTKESTGELIESLKKQT